jgi:flavin-binding protein dodecin
VTWETPLIWCATQPRAAATSCLRPRLAAQIHGSAPIVHPRPSRRGLFAAHRAGEWTVKQILLHISDDERIYVYRTLRFLITTHRATGLSWRQAAERVVDDACNNYDDARVGEVHRLRCRVLATGQIEFDAEMKLSTKFRGGVPT